MLKRTNSQMDAGRHNSAASYQRIKQNLDTRWKTDHNQTTKQWFIVRTLADGTEQREAVTDGYAALKEVLDRNKANRNMK